MGDVVPGGGISWWYCFPGTTVPSDGEYKKLGYALSQILQERWTPMEQAKMGLELNCATKEMRKNLGNPDCDLDSKPSMDSRNEASD
ncbi:hypothetical protein ACRRTK_009883 [Alexandromys fortis]